MNRRDLFGGVCAFFAGLFGFSSTVKAAPVEPIWGKQGEWIPYHNDPLGLQYGERRVYRVQLPDMTTEQAEKFLQKIKEKLRKKKHV